MSEDKKMTAEEALQELQTQFESVQDFGNKQCACEEGCSYLEEGAGLNFLAIIRTELAALRAKVSGEADGLALRELHDEVSEYFERQPTHDCQDITPRTMAILLRKFSRIMAGASCR